MKKTILILSAVALTFASCKKEEVEPVVTPTTNEYIPDCDCDELLWSFTSFNLVAMLDQYWHICNNKPMYRSANQWRLG